ncbi:hypothetical protein [Actinophytocola sediminis]
MTELTRLTLADGVRLLAATGTRGFLGLDPVTQNYALLAQLLSARQARLFGAGDAVVGYAPNLDQPRQAQVATTSTDPEVLTGFTDYLRRYGRYTSFLCLDGPSTALRGFRLVGTLRAHVYRGGGYHDVDVHLSTGSQPCA